MGRDKALVVVDGVAMGARMVGTLRLAGCDPVVFVGGEPGLLDPLGADVVADIAPGEGPLGGVVTALDHFAHTADHVVVVSCDMPFLTPADLAPLVARAAVAGVDVVVGRSSRQQPLCAVWSTGAADQVRAAFERGTRSIHGALDELRTEDVRVSMQAVRNINTLDDLDQ
jgi:molybdenum cofactor guanylyltransferase